MSFTAPLFTNVGKQLHARALSGDCAIKFTGIALGNGDLTTQAIAALTCLISEQMRLELDIYQRIDHETVNVRTTFNNSELTAGFYWREVGLYAQNPDDPDNRDADILYCYQNAGDLAEYIPSIDSQVMEKTISITTKISDTAEVTAILKSEVFASKEAFEAYQEEANQTFVHLTGAETIEGKKSFKNTVEFKTQAPSVYLVDEFFSKEDEELPFKNSEARVVFQDADNNNTAMVISSFTSDGTQKLILRAYNPNGTTYTEMALCYPPDGGAPYATAPTTAEEVPGSHIATTKYVNARYLRMDGSNAMAADLNMGGNSLADVLGIELRPGANVGHGGLIDFHFNGSASDYTARIMEDAKGHITILAPNGLNVDGLLSTVAGFTVRAQDGATEGGEILLEASGASGATHMTVIDNQSNTTRIFSRDPAGNIGARLDLKHDTGQAFWNGQSLITSAGGDLTGALKVAKYLYVTASGEVEGGEIQLSPPTGYAGYGSVSIDYWQNCFRMFNKIEQFLRAEFDTKNFYLFGELAERVVAIGSNYIRWYSGLQICWTTHNNANSTWTFPLAFSSNPAILLAPTGSGSNPGIHWDNLTTTSVYLGNSSSWSNSAVAIGKWK